MDSPDPAPLAGVQARPRDMIDAHCHVASRRFISRTFVDGAVKNLLAMHEATGLPPNPRLADQYMESLEDHGCDELVRQMDEAGIAWTVLLLPDFTYVMRDYELTIEEMFRLHHEILKRHPGRFHVMAGVDPRWGKDAVTLFQKGVDDLGFRGLKLYPPCGYRTDDRALYPFYEICAAADIPVLVHIGPTTSALGFEYARPGFIDEPARAFPKIKFILAHAATAHTEECAMQCAFRPNVYADISGFQSMAHDMEASGVHHLLRTGIAHKLLFGTDWPVFREDGTQADHVDLFMGAVREDYSEAQIRLVARDNARRLFGDPPGPRARERANTP